MLPKDCPTCQENHAPEDLFRLSEWMELAVKAINDCLEISLRNTERIGELRVERDKRDRELAETISSLAMAFGQVVKDRHVEPPLPVPLSSENGDEETPPAL